LLDFLRVLGRTQTVRVHSDLHRNDRPGITSALLPGVLPRKEVIHPQLPLRIPCYATVISNYLECRTMSSSSFQRSQRMASTGSRQLTCPC